MSKFIYFWFCTYKFIIHIHIPFPENIYFAAAIPPDLTTSPSDAKFFSINDSNLIFYSQFNIAGFLSCPTPINKLSFKNNNLLNGFVSLIETI